MSSLPSMMRRFTSRLDTPGIPANTSDQSTLISSSPTRSRNCSMTTISEPHRPFHSSTTSFPRPIFERLILLFAIVLIYRFFATDPNCCPASPSKPIPNTPLPGAPLPSRRLAAHNLPRNLGSSISMPAPKSLPQTHRATLSRPCGPRPHSHLPYHQRIHRDQSNLIPLDPEVFIQKALTLLASDRYLEKGVALMALTGRRPAEIFFSATFSLPRTKLLYPALIFDGQLKTRQAPGTSFEPYPIPVLGDPKKIVQALDRLRDLKSFPSPKAVNATTGPQFPKYHAFGSLDKPWKPGHLRSAYAAICCQRFKPQNQTDDIFLAHKLLGPNASLSVGQSYKDFYVKTAR